LSVLLEDIVLGVSDGELEGLLVDFYSEGFGREADDGVGGDSGDGGLGAPGFGEDGPGGVFGERRGGTNSNAEDIVAKGGDLFVRGTGAEVDAVLERAEAG